MSKSLILDGLAYAAALDGGRLVVVDLKPSAPPTLDPEVWARVVAAAGLATEED